MRPAVSQHTPSDVALARVVHHTVAPMVAALTHLKPPSVCLMHVAIVIAPKPLARCPVMESVKEVTRTVRERRLCFYSFRRLAHFNAITLFNSWIDAYCHKAGKGTKLVESDVSPLHFKPTVLFSYILHFQRFLVQHPVIL